MKNPEYSAPFFPWKSGVSTLHAYTDQTQAARAEAWGSMRRMQAGAAEDARGCDRRGGECSTPPKNVRLGVC